MVEEAVYEAVSESHSHREHGYEEINDVPEVDDEVESSWSEFSDESVTINYYIHPVNEYENTNWKVYENYMESGGYDDPVCSGEVCKRQPTAKGQTEQKLEKDEAVRNNPVESNEEAEGYEIPVKSDIVLTYNILSNSPIETVLFN